MKKQITLLLIIVIVFLTFYSVYYYSNYRVRHVPVISNEEALDSTQVVSSWYNGNFSQNLLYSPGLPIAFNQFKDTFSLQPEGFQTLDTIFPANLPPFELPNRFLIEKAGRFNDTTLSRIRWLENRHLNNDFEFDPPWQKGDWFIFSHYYFPVLFKNTFQLSQEPLDFKGEKVRGLVTIKNAQKQAEQLQVYKKSETHFALEYSTPDNGELVMAMLPPQHNLRQTYELADEWLSGNEGQPLEGKKGILLPVMDFYLSKYTTGSIRNHQATLSACQRISYSMNAEYSFLTSQPSESTLKFDQPFLIYHIPPEAKEPIFLMWVAHPEILMPMDKPG